MEMNGLMGGLYRISEWIMRFSMTNLLWIIFAAPFFYFALLLLMSESVDQAYMTLVIMGVISPFVWFPSTAAMFTVARKWVLGDVDVPLFKTFIRGYKENYKQSMFGGIIYTLLIILMIVNYRFYLNLENGFQALSILFLILSVLIVVSLFHFFSIMTHLHMKTLQIVKNAIMLTLGRPITTILIGATNAFILYLSTQFTFLIPFFMGTGIAYMSFFHFNRMFQKVQDQQKKLEEDEEADQEEEEVEENDTTINSRNE